MQRRDLTTIASLRMTVAYLGEKDQSGWWPSSLCSTNSTAFLAPAFPRSLNLARYEALVLAAQRVHDDHVGLGEVYHLFRLPEDMEQRIHEVIRDGGEDEIRIPESKESALEVLEGLGSQSPDQADGPVRIGKPEDVHLRRIWTQAAGLYLNAFVLGHQVHPYLAER